jgi:hypothetical protein
MDYFDFLFPEQQQAHQLRRLTDAKIRALNRASTESEKQEALSRENRELRIYLTAVMQVLIEKGLITANEIQGKLVGLLPPLPETPTIEPEPEKNPFAEFGR